MAVKAVASAGLKLCEPLVCFGLKTVLRLPDGVAVAIAEKGVDWLKGRFADHSQALPRAVATAHDRAWQVVALALAGDTLLGRVANFFRDGDVKAIQTQIRRFVASADTGLDGTPDGLRVRACGELHELKKAGRLTADVDLTPLDLARFASPATVAQDARAAVHAVAASLQADAPNLVRVLTLTPPAGGMPLLAVAFEYFLRRKIETNAELARGLLADQVRLLVLKQQAGFANLETLLGEATGDVIEAVGGAAAVLLAELDHIKANQAAQDAKLDDLLAGQAKANQALIDVTDFISRNRVDRRAEAPNHISVRSDTEKELAQSFLGIVRGLPAAVVTADLASKLGDALAAAGEYAAAKKQHAAAEAAAKDRAERADAAFKQFNWEMPANWNSGTTRTPKLLRTIDLLTPTTSARCRSGTTSSACSAPARTAWCCCAATSPRRTGRGTTRGWRRRRSAPQTWTSPLARGARRGGRAQEAGSRERHPHPRVGGSPAATERPNVRHGVSARRHAANRS